MKFIFPSAINGNLLKLVHLSNGFRMVEGAGPLQVGEVCRAEARIASVTNTKAGKVVKVKGHVYREDKPVIEVVSSFFYRGRFTNFGISCHYDAATLRAKMAEIQSKIPPGVSITLNTLYINPRQFGFQFPLWQEMRKERLPVEGFCVAAGIPSTEKTAEIIEGLTKAGIKHISFKPGSVDGIRQVVNIAPSNPDFPIVLQ